MIENNDFDAITRKAQARAREQDRSDLNNEQAGRDVGRIARHLPGDGAKSETPEARRKRARAFRDLLDHLLQSDPIYAAAYGRASEVLSRAERVTDAALAAARAKLAVVEAGHAALKDRASRLADGTRVFRDADGRVLDAEGRVVSDAAAASVVWQPGSPSYEAFRQSRRSVADARDTLAALERYEVDVLGRWRDRLDDREAPPSQDELDALMEDIQARAPEAIKPQLEEGWTREQAQASSAPSDQSQPSPQMSTPRSTSIEIPTI